MGWFNWLRTAEEEAREEARAEDRQLIRETIQAMKESQIETARMLSEAIKSIAGVQTAQAGAIQTHLELFKAPQEALQNTLDSVPELDPETQGDGGEFPWNASPAEQAAWLNAHLDDD